MKINDILAEAQSDKIKVFDHIINSTFFKNNYMDMIKNNDLDTILDAKHNWLYHASDKMENDYGVMELRLRENPRDTAKYVHDVINNLATKKFGYPIRNLLFSFTKKAKIVDFGYDYYVLFPLDDDYKLFYAEGISDFTEYYKNSKHGSDRFVQFIDHFSEKYRDFKQLPNIHWLYRGNVSKFNAVSSDQDVYEMAYDIFIEYDVDEEHSKKYAKAFMNSHRKFVESEASDYISRIKIVDKIKKQDEEYMIYSKNIGYVRVKDSRELLEYAKSKL